MSENVIDFNRRKAERARQQEEKAREKAEQEQQKAQDLLAGAEEFITQHPMRFVRKHNCYWMQNASGEWYPVKPMAMSKSFGIWDADFGRAVTYVLEQKGWSGYANVTYSYRQDLPPDILNLLSTEGWLQPDVGEHHWIFDVLVRSLGGNKTENMDHLEHCLVYKCLHPEAYTLPAFLIHGEGGVGKNVFVSGVLKAIFDGQVTATAAANVIGAFNSLLVGKAVVMIDESMEDKTDSAAMKILIGNQTFTVNEKGIPQFDADLTAWVWIGSNQHEGGLWLDGTEADRRYSVFHVRDGESLDYWIAKHQGWLKDRMTDDEVQAQRHRAKQWMFDEGFKLLTDKAQVAHWLGYLFLKHSDRPHPMPLHGEDYRRLLGIQEKVEKRIIAAVFNDPDFSHIASRTLYEGYKLEAERAGQKGKLKDSRFDSQIAEWLKANDMTHIKKERVQQTWLDGGKTEKRTVWYDASKQERLRKIVNDFQYLTEEGHKSRWCGPEI